MYNKLFTKILDSSIWLENQPTRLVWITFLACMDQDSIVQLSSIGNVANRARVSDVEAEEAISVLESPDIHNPDQEQEGRRIERIPGVGWFVINAEKYRDIIKAETARAKTRERVKEWREQQKVIGNADVTPCNDSVTPSDSDAEEEIIQYTDPRKVHPAIIAIFEVTGQMPTKDVWDTLIETLGSEINLVRLKDCFRKWRARGFKPTNFSWALDWYIDGIPDLKGGKNGTNRKSDRAKQTPAEIIASRPYYQDTD